MTHIDSEILQLIPYFLPRILVSTICGAIIGYNRELKQKVAGVRTFILISVGCTIFSSISFLLSSIDPSIDPTRIIGQVCTGIGFLGGGVIFKTENKVVGVTTAAFIWVVSAIGILSGTGAIITPIAITLFILLISIIFEKLELYIKKPQIKESE